MVCVLALFPFLQLPYSRSIVKGKKSMKKAIAIVLFLTMFLTLTSAVAEKDALVLWEGEATASKSNITLVRVATRHRGGIFNASAMTNGSKITVEYEGPEKSAFYAVLFSYTGGPGRKNLVPTQITTLENGRRLAELPYESLYNKVGGQLNLLDEITFESMSSNPVTLYSVRYVEGDGIAIDHGSGAWALPDTGIAFLGDSITEYVRDVEGGFNQLLGREDCSNYGIGGNTSQNMLNRTEDIACRNYSQLVIWCGINDFLHEDRSSEYVMGNVEKIIEIMRADNPNIRFAILSVLPTSQEQFSDPQRIVKLNELYKAYADANGDVDFCDLYPYYAAEDGYVVSGLMDDGLHPNHAGYAILAEHLPSYLLPEE